MLEEENFPGCLLHLEEPIPAVSDNATKWLGFDKYKRVIYGIQEYYDNITKPDLFVFDLNKLSLLVGIDKVVKTYEILLSREGNYSFEWTLSENGESIAGLEFYYTNEGSCFFCSFYLICVEDGLLKRYPVVNELNEPELRLPDSKESFWRNIYHTEALGWILKHCFLPDWNDGGMVSVNYYDIQLDNAREIAIVQYWREGEKFFSKTFDVWFDRCLVTFNDDDNYQCTVSKINCGEKESKRILSYLSFNGHDMWPIGANKENVFTFNTPFHLFHCNFDSNENNWEELKRITKRDVYAFPSGLSDHNNLLFIYGLEAMFDDEPLIHCILLPMNVLSLRDICFRQLIGLYKKLFPERKIHEKEICQYFNLPIFLNRKYFGPDWMVNVSSIRSDIQNTSFLCQ